jgi:chemotaxis signal transduction protein
MQLGQVWMALRANHVQEILGALAWVAIPGAPAHLPGVLPWRGRAVAVLDLGGATGLVQKPLGQTRARTVIAQARGSTVAIPVDAVQEVQLVDEAAVRPSHMTRQRHSLTEVEVKGVPMPLLDLEEIMKSLGEAAA